jgi:hypothetical protein
MQCCDAAAIPVVLDGAAGPWMWAGIRLPDLADELT